MLKLARNIIVLIEDGIKGCWFSKSIAKPSQQETPGCTIAY
jgi:hypothetical protein